MALIVTRVTSIQALRGKLSVGNYNFEMLQKPYFREQIRSPYFASQIRGKYRKSVAVNTSGTGVQDTSNLEIITQGQVYRIRLTLICRLNFWSVTFCTLVILSPYSCYLYHDTITCIYEILLKVVLNTNNLDSYKIKS